MKDATYTCKPSVVEAAQGIVQVVLGLKWMDVAYSLLKNLSYMTGEIVLFV